MLTENLGLRIFSLFLAVLIWMQSVLVTEHKSIISLPVQLKSVPKNVTLENLPKTIPFAVKGKGLEIIKLLISNPQVTIDASSITPNTDIISLTDYTVDLPENVNLTLIGPAQSDRIAVQADVFHKRDVAVQLDFADEQSRRYFSELKYSIIPEKVTIFGPKSKVQSISELKTVQISRDMLSEPSLDLDLLIPEQEISVSESIIKVNLSGIQESVKIFTDVGLPSQYIPSKVAVKVQGTRRVLDKLTSTSIVAKVLPSTEGDGMSLIEVQLPLGVKLIAVTPDKVRIRQ